MKNIPIVYCTNKNGLDQLVVSLFSLLKNKNEFSFYKIYIFIDSINDFNTEKLENVVSRFNNCSIQFIDCSEYDVKYQIPLIQMNKKKLQTVKWPAPAYYRLLIPLILKEHEKVLYLDIDTLILSDLQELFDQELKGYVGGVINYPFAAWMKWMNESIRNNKPIDDLWRYEHFDDGSTDYDNYLQSGVLLFNIKKWENINFDKFFCLIKQNNFTDEDIINYVFKKDLTILNVKYNFCLHFFDKENISEFNKRFNLSIDQFDSLFKQAKIIHFSLKAKPTLFVNDLAQKTINQLGSLEKFINLINDWDTFSIIYNINESSKLGWQIHNYSLAYDELEKNDGVKGFYKQVYNLWVKYANLLNLKNN